MKDPINEAQQLGPSLVSVQGREIRAFNIDLNLPIGDADDGIDWSTGEFILIKNEGDAVMVAFFAEDICVVDVQGEWGHRFTDWEQFWSKLEKWGYI